MWREGNQRGQIISLEPRMRAWCPINGACVCVCVCVCVCMCVCLCVYPVVHSSLCLCVRRALSSEGSGGGYVAAVTGSSHEGAIHRWIAPRMLRRPHHSFVGLIRTLTRRARVRFGGAATTIMVGRLLTPRSMTLALLWCVGDTPLRHRRCTLDELHT